jgi:hypothetical protein
VCDARDLSPLVGSFFITKHRIALCRCCLLPPRDRFSSIKLLLSSLPSQKAVVPLPEFLLIAACLLCVSVCGFRLPALLLQDKYTRYKDREKLEKSHIRILNVSGSASQPSSSQMSTECRIKNENCRWPIN